MSGHGGSTARRYAGSSRRGRRASRWVLGALAGLLVVALGTGGWIWFNAQRALDRATAGQGGSIIDVFLPGQPTLPTGKHASATPTSRPSGATATPGRATVTGGSTTAPGGTGSGRTNVLVAGNSFDDPGHAGADMTDGIMVASIDNASGRTSLVSVPRDLWVTSGGSSTKINAVYARAGGGHEGLRVLGDVVERVTGLPIDAHLLVGVNATKGLVDAVGGIDVTIKTSDPRGIGDPNTGLYLTNGDHHLDGETALKLARARNDPIPGKEDYGLPGNDFSRQQNQQLIIAALLKKMRSTAALANPVTLVNLFNELSSNVTTDLSISNVRAIYALTSKAGQPTSFTIRGDASHRLLTDYTAPPAYDALVPVTGVADYSAIHAFVEASLAR